MLKNICIFEWVKHIYITEIQQFFVANRSK